MAGRSSPFRGFFSDLVIYLLALTDGEHASSLASSYTGTNSTEECSTLH